MVILMPAMVITILMTIVSEKMMVSGWSENGVFHHRHHLGAHTDKLWKAETPSTDVETPPNVYLCNIRKIFTVPAG